MIPALTPEIWGALTPDERDTLRARMIDISGGESLRDFITRLAPHHPPPPHLNILIDELEGCRVSPRRVCVSMPPGHIKTELILNAIAWWMTKNPADTNAYFSYNMLQAHSKSVLAREIANQAGVSLSEDVNTKGEWRTVEGGGLLAGGVNSGFTGQRVTGLLVIDDPFKGPIDAYSQLYRDQVDDWFRKVALSRMFGASAFVIHTRWHQDDLIGRLATRRGWRVINLAAIAEENDPIGRAPGEALWPDFYPTSKLLEIKEDQGDFGFAALYQGTPRPRGGSVFGEPHYYDPATLDLTGCQFVLACDPAASEKTSADYSVIVVFAILGKGKDARAYLLNVYRRQVAIPQLVADLVSWQKRYGNTAINVESVGGFKAIPQMLRALDRELRIKEIVPMGDKFTRAQGVAAGWNSARLLVPSDAPPWLGAVLDELAYFTGQNDKHDDIVDGLAHAWNNSIMSGKTRSILDVLR